MFLNIFTVYAIFNPNSENIILPISIGVTTATPQYLYHILKNKLVVKFFQSDIKQLIVQIF